MRHAAGLPRTYLRDQRLRGTFAELLRESEEMRALWREAGEDAAPDRALGILE